MRGLIPAIRAATERPRAPGRIDPYPWASSTWLQSGAGAIAGIAFAAVLMLSAVLTELRPVTRKPTQPLASPPPAQVAPQNRFLICKEVFS